MRSVLVRLALSRMQDLVAARQLARLAAQLLGLEAQDRVRFATAVSELARSALEHQGGGELVLGLNADAHPAELEATVRMDCDPSVPAELHDAALVAARRLIDALEVERTATELRLVASKALPAARSAVAAAEAARIADALTRARAVVDPFAEVARQNGELMATLESLRQRQDELERLNGELEDTNRGVMALYAELDERAEQLRRADAMKSRFLSDMSHEFRAPLNSMLAISRLLTEESDGPLNAEQRRQMGFVRGAAEELYEMVNDLLDLAKVEAGKVDVRPAPFTLGEMFSTLRGLVRPLLPEGRPVELVVEEPPTFPLDTDEGKVSQILRNLLSNAVKFTERGEVRLSATAGADDTVRFCVADTGIGIHAADHERIFSEFGQLDTPLHAHVKGTGLGLALSRRLAALLAGRIELESEPGSGSTFTLVVPRVFLQAPAAPPASPIVSPAPQPPVLLVIEDDPAFAYLLGDLGRRLGMEVILAADGRDGLAAIGSAPPDAVALDLVMPGLDGFAVLEHLRTREDLVGLPVVIVTSLDLGAEERERIARLHAALLPKKSLAGAGGLERMRSALASAGLPDLAPTRRNA